MKVDELRVLEEDELGGRLKAARRELYELRFKHAVGQLENASQISKVRHDIARIMTVLREREFGIVAQAAPESVTAVAVAEPEEQRRHRGSKPSKNQAEARPRQGETEDGEGVMSVSTPTKPQVETTERGQRKVRLGTVISDKGEKTIIVQIGTSKAHRLYKKTVQQRTKFKVHDEKNECGVGDLVRITETRPISKEKRWRLLEIVEKAR